MTIFIGYQGIGKSTLTKMYDNFVDFESGNFYVDGVRPSDWYKPYCNCALDLSSQGLNVFTASHQVVRDRFKELNKYENIYVICPSLELKDLWIEKLHKRYVDSQLDKDYRAWKNAEDRYTENIKELHQSFPSIEITSMDYDLYSLLEPYLSHKQGVLFSLYE